MQKYRIFVSDRVINFSENESWTPLVGRIVLRGPRIPDLHRWLKKLEQDNTIREISVHVEDPQTFFQDFVRSMKGIQAAGGVVECGGKALFIYRFGRWDLPKGKMEPGESPGQTALREVEEECGVGQLELKGRFSDTWHIYLFEGQHVVKQTSWFGMSTCYRGIPRPQVEEGIEKVAWIEPSAWNRVVIPHTYPSLLPLLKEAKLWILQKTGVENP